MPRPVTSAMVKALNQHLGGRIAERRKSLSLSVKELERALILSHGTLVRIERGDKVLDAGLLIALEQALDVPVSFFFEDLPATDTGGKLQVPPPERVREMMIFLEQFHDIRDNAKRLHILALVRAVAESGDY